MSDVAVCSSIAHGNVLDQKPIALIFFYLQLFAAGSERGRPNLTTRSETEKEKVFLQKPKEKEKNIIQKQGQGQVLGQLQIKTSPLVKSELSACNKSLPKPVLVMMPTTENYKVFLVI